MIFRLYPTRDTWITNLVPDSWPNESVSGSNFGKSEILWVFKKNPISSGSSGWAGSSSLGRILTQFDLSDWSSLTASLGYIPNASWRLVLRDARHDSTLPSSFDLEVCALSSSWDEGRGADDQLFKDKGPADWVRRKSNLYWSSRGGDVLSGPYPTAHFDEGDEDLKVDVTRVVNSWISGSVPNNGFCVRMSSSLESSSLDLFVKKFHSRQTNFLDRRPFLEASWDDSLRDDRSHIEWGVNNTIFLYNISRGVLTDVPGVNGRNCFSVLILDASGTIATVSGSSVSTGIYSASFNISSGSYSGSYFRDVWVASGSAFLTASFQFSNSRSSQVPFTRELHLYMPGLMNEYRVENKARLRLDAVPEDYNPPVYVTSSNYVPPMILDRCYYQITNDRTKEIVVAFGTGSYVGGTDSTRLSYDGFGNYFDFAMVNLSPGNVYRISYLVDFAGVRRYMDGGFKFKVVT